MHCVSLIGQNGTKRPESFLFVHVHQQDTGNARHSLTIANLQINSLLKLCINAAVSDVDNNIINISATSQFQQAYWCHYEILIDLNVLMTTTKL